jgi:hypothetical protein
MRRTYLDCIDLGQPLSEEQNCIPDPLQTDLSCIVCEQGIDGALSVSSESVDLR